MLGIVILNYNTWDDTIACIESLLKFTKIIKGKIYVVDNASPTTPQKSLIQKLNELPMVNLIYAKRNKGYAAGNNIGLKKALEDGCDAVLICNSDIIFVDDSINKMLCFLEEHKNIGLIGPQIYNRDLEFQPIYMLSKLTGSGKIKNMFLNTPMRKVFSNFEKNFIQKSEIHEPLKVFGVSGCCFLISRPCLEYLFPLDENTFLYEEEYIIGVKLENTVFKNYVLPNTCVIHAHGGATGGMTSFSYDCLVESEQYYLKKYIKCNILLRKLIFLIRKITKKYRVK
ncbi:glycosyltransferase [Sellimonas catena]|uniref:Rhamnosyltransferase n=1 Tax=Sellimonas catena TaxID=2994035 RepID=A0A9W6CDL8_9FIRM|nr:glycosyltransferase family 2 protein [Sellimonas catena]GLG89815.1 rhamnosyltransferase [Sellimonas catena]